VDNRHIDTDVIIVGGGPAGSAAAIGCATRGLRVMLFERDRFARERPGETLHPGAEPLLRQLGIADDLPSVVGARHKGIWIEWGGPRRFEAFGGDGDGPWSGLQVWRGALDALLLRRAQEAGAVVRQPCAVTGALLHDGAIGGVTTAAGPVTAAVVIDATGRTRWLGRALTVANTRRSPRLVARYGYATGCCPMRDDAPALVGDASGWTWTAMVRPHTYQWTRVCFGRSQLNPDWMPDELRGLTPVSRSRGADVTWRLATQVASPGWFMVGDAAALLDPTSSRGVLKAIMSGMMAAHLAAAVIGGKVPAAAAADAYGNWVAEWFAVDAARLAQFYQGLGVAGFG
jgi:flavin-dependent dehydrogenase